MLRNTKIKLISIKVLSKVVLCSERVGAMIRNRAPMMLPIYGLILSNTQPSKLYEHSKVFKAERMVL